MHNRDNYIKRNTLTFHSLSPLLSIHSLIGLAISTRTDTVFSESSSGFSELKECWKTLAAALEDLHCALVFKEDMMSSGSPITLSTVALTDKLLHLAFETNNFLDLEKE